MTTKPVRVVAVEISFSSRRVAELDLAFLHLCGSYQSAGESRPYCQPSKVESIQLDLVGPSSDAFAEALEIFVRQACRQRPDLSSVHTS